LHNLLFEVAVTFVIRPRGRTVAGISLLVEVHASIAEANSHKRR
jgi:hypothetical protein